MSQVYFWETRLEHSVCSLLVTVLKALQIVTTFNSSTILLTIFNVYFHLQIRKWKQGRPGCLIQIHKANIC